MYSFQSGASKGKSSQPSAKHLESHQESILNTTTTHKPFLPPKHPNNQVISQPKQTIAFLNSRLKKSPKAHQAKYESNNLLARNWS